MDAVGTKVLIIIIGLIGISLALLPFLLVEPNLTEFTTRKMVFTGVTLWATAAYFWKKINSNNELEVF